MAGKVENKTKHALRYKTRTKALRAGYKTEHRGLVIKHEGTKYRFPTK